MNKDDRSRDLSKQNVISIHSSVLYVPLILDTFRSKYINLVITTYILTISKHVYVALVKDTREYRGRAVLNYKSLEQIASDLSIITNLRL